MKRVGEPYYPDSIETKDEVVEPEKTTTIKMRKFLFTGKIFDAIEAVTKEEALDHFRDCNEDTNFDEIEVDEVK